MSMGDKIRWVFEKCHWGCAEFVVSASYASGLEIDPRVTGTFFLGMFSLSSAYSRRESCQ